MGWFAFVAYQAIVFFHNGAFSALLKAPISFFDQNPVGRILNRLSGDVTRMDIFTGPFFAYLNFSIADTLSLFLLICISSPYLLLMVPPSIGVSYYFYSYYRKTMLETQRCETVSHSEVSAVFHEALTGKSTLKAFGCQILYFRKFQSSVDFNHALVYQRGSYG